MNLPAGEQARQEFNTGMLDFIHRSPTPFHAVKNMAGMLEQAGFLCLAEDQAWNLEPGGRYYTVRNGSSLVAFSIAEGDSSAQGMRLMGAHTDSPCLKVKPNADLHKHGFHRLGVEVYGGVLLAPWFDRDLSMAGRVSYRNKQGAVADCLINFESAVACIPSLAIHLDRDVNDKRSINKQLDLPVVLSLKQGRDKPAFKDILAARLHEEGGVADLDQILDFEISLYDTQPPAIIGLKEEFISSARLDNLLSCYVTLHALIHSDSPLTSILVANDHEEVGSASAAGAAGPMLHDCIARLSEAASERIPMLQKSMLVSVDNAHGLHPNFASRHDENHGPLLNAGPVIKVNANQRYASNSHTQAVFRQCAERVNVDVQSFVVRSDMACGSTIGPITASELGVQTVDVGVPTFAMHSIRELAGSHDAWQLSSILQEFLASDSI